MQEATVPNANGIRVVLMGDGFSDRQIQSGLYSELMKQTMEAFFQQEPFSSHRQYFDVGYVDVVSKHEMVMEGNETALECYLGSGTTIGGNDETCREYAKSSGLTTDSELNETLIVVLANTVEHHGTCYMYGDYQYTGDYGRGHAVAYFTLEEPGLINVGTAIHEAAGHGFGKLSDEYVSYSMTLPDYRKDDNLRLNETSGGIRMWTIPMTRLPWPGAGSSRTRDMRARTSACTREVTGMPSASGVRPRTAS